MEYYKLTGEDIKQLGLMSADVIPNYTDEKIEHMTQEWIEFVFLENDWETKEQFEHRKEIMLKLLINEKLKRMEAEYAQEAI